MTTSKQQVNEEQPSAIPSGKVEKDKVESAEVTIQGHIDRGYIECPECGTHRGVDKQGNVLGCGKCSDVFPAQAAPWNLFITLH